MFEAIVAICLEGADGPCRDALIPGYRATTLDACAAALAANPPEPEARCAPVGFTLDMEEVAEGIFVHLGRIEEPDRQNRGDVSNFGFVIGDKSVAVIDTGTAPWLGEALWRAIRRETDKPVSHVILTHVHPDHVFGASVFAAAGSTLVGHAGLPRALADRRANYLESMEALMGAETALGLDIPAISQLIDGPTRIDLGGRELTLQPWQTAHSGTDVTVLDGATGTLFAGDLVFDDHLPALDGSLRGWQAVLTQLKALDAVRVIPGHGGPVLPWPEGAAPLEAYLNLLASDTLAAIEAGDRLGHAITHIAGESAADWSLFDEFNPRNATVAFTELEWE